MSELLLSTWKKVCHTRRETRTMISKNSLVNHNPNSKDLTQKMRFTKKISRIGKEIKIRPKPPVHKLSKNKLLQLEEHFFMNGITAYKASKLVGVDYKTANSYFNEWAKKLTTDEKYETWVDKNTRVKARALEGLANKIFDVRKIQKRFSQRLEKIMNKIEFMEKRSKNTRELEKLESKVESYERIVRYNTILESELQQQYNSLEIIPPPKVVLEAEIEKFLRPTQEKKFLNTEEKI